MMTFVLQYGWSPLHVASFNGHLDIVRALIEAGANIRQANKVGTAFVNQCHCTTCALVSREHVIASKIVVKTYMYSISSLNFNSNPTSYCFYDETCLVYSRWWK